jgi:hypothetical protein
MGRPTVTITNEQQIMQAVDFSRDRDRDRDDEIVTTKTGTATARIRTTIQNTRMRKDSLLFYDMKLTDYSSIRRRANIYDI